jgi:DNA-binding transcriptional MerR regulator
MQINSFAQKYNTPLSTIRYYIKAGLLIPDTVGNRYEFTKSTMNDMETICKLKTWKFSLVDIATILAQNRISNETDYESQIRIKELFEKYYQTMLQEKLSIDERLNTLQKAMENMDKQNSAQAHDFATGVDTLFLSYLYCPHCDKRLTVLPKEIKDGQIYYAALGCDCGYNAIIENGILCIPQNKAEINFSSTDINRDCYKNLNKAEINSIYKLERWLFNRLDSCYKENDLVVEISINDYCFLYSQIEKLNPNILYILSDCSLDLIKKYKNRIESLNKSLKILYIAGDNINLPIKKHSIDIYIDFFKNNRFAKYNDHFLFKDIEEYLHTGSYIIGAYAYVKPNSPSTNKHRQIFQDGYKNNYSINSFLEDQRQNNFDLLDNYSDEPIKKSSLNWHVDGDELRHFCYCAKLK